MNNIQILIKRLVSNAVIPENAKKLDTGYDLVAVSEPNIVGKKCKYTDLYWDSIDYVEYKTGLQISPQRIVDLANQEKYFYTLLFPRSSVSKYNLTLANSIGLVDAEYRGEILLRFKYHWQPEDFIVMDGGTVVGNLNKNKIYKQGDKIAQIVGMELNVLSFKETENLDATQRGEGGFGSTGR